jgi:hypothetical protein
MFPWLLQKVVEGASELDGCYAKPLVSLFCLGRSAVNLAPKRVQDAPHVDARAHPTVSQILRTTS